MTKKVLIVDDSAVFRAQLERDLQEFGYEVVSADNGAEGVEVLNAHSDVSLIISDLNMPGMDGIEMLRVARTSTSHKSTPAFMLTTEGSPSIKAAGKEVGVMLWIVKPYTKDKVMLVVKQVLKA
jgi:two-component system chemotaxis response regulator CheY